LEHERYSQEQLDALAGRDAVSFERLWAAITAHIGSVMRTLGQPRWGLVTGYDPVNHLAKVTTQPDGNQTGWLPILTTWAGNGWGELTPLSVGQQVKLIPENGDANNLVILGPAYSTVRVPPQAPNAIGGGNVAAAEGERIFVSKAGAVFRMCADGSGYFKPAAGTAFNIDGNAVVGQNLTVLGDFTVDGTAEGSTGAIVAKGEISDLNGVHGTVDVLRSAHNTHGHPSVPALGTAAPPNTVTP
jgi:phage baseplate assembly protein gpV